MKPWQRVVVVLGVVISGLTGVFIAFLAFFDLGICANTVFTESVSPNGTFKAIVFDRDCGATTGFSTQISILRSTDELPNEPGNIFTTDGHPRETRISIRWVDDAKLVIGRPRGSGYRAEEVWEPGNVQIGYAPTGT